MRSSAGQVSEDLPRHINSSVHEQSKGSHEQEVDMEKKKVENERRMIAQPACCRRPPNRPEGFRGFALLVGPSSFFIALLWEEEKEEKEEEAQVLFLPILLRCAATAMWARVPLSLVVVWWLWTSS